MACGPNTLINVAITHISGVMSTFIKVGFCEKGHNKNES